MNATGKRERWCRYTVSPDQGNETVAASGRRGDKHILQGPRKETKRMNKPYTNTQELPYTLSVEEMAAFLGISRVGAYNLSHSKGFPSKRIGKRILIPRDEFLAWLKELPEVSNG